MGLTTILNAAAVGLFGAILSASFCDVSWNKTNKLIYGGTMLAIGLLQAAMTTSFNLSGFKKLYPLITHLPLALALFFITKKKLWSVTAVLTAYLCCQLRRWTALLFVALLSGGDTMQSLFEIVITLPMLMFLLRYVSAAVRMLSQYPLAMQFQFSLIPMVSYLFDYLTRIYTDWLEQGITAAVEFMPFICAVAFLIFVIYSTQALRERSEMEQVQMILDLQVKQSARQLENMKKSQQKLAADRHDLRHHLQYLSACIKNNELEQAQSYIRNLNEKIINEAVVQYCENTAANLILSSHAGRAKEAGVRMEIRMSMQEFSHISDNDFCVLLSNALENALNACTALKAQGKEPVIKVYGYEKGNRIFLEVINSCEDSVVLENGIPTTQRKGHGLGVRSICAIVEKYGGVYSFEIKNGYFILQISA